jgi:hypothetical protein
MIDLAGLGAPLTERAPLNEIVARYLKAIGDPREVVSDPSSLLASLAPS